MLFTINNTQYKIRQGTYKVNEYDVYTEWTDANCDIHRSVLKRRISGSFVLYFEDEQDYTSFLDNLESVRGNDGSYSVGLMCNNSHQFRNTSVFIDFRPTREQKVIGQAYYPDIQMNIQGK